MAYQECIKNFERVREYMRQFYVYGFKSRGEYDGKSPRSYDDERRRVESWLGEYMRFRRTPEGKQVFLSVDSRAVAHNPLFAAFRAKSFTDGDITLHFILFDILHGPAESYTLREILAMLDERYLCGFEKPRNFDESTVRKKLREYVTEGIVVERRQGREVRYARTPDVPLHALTDALDFFSETAPCGVLGAFLREREAPGPSAFGFKHNYIAYALDSDVLCTLLRAMGQQRWVTAEMDGKRQAGAREKRTLAPLRILVGAQSGRQYLLAYDRCRFRSCRLDRIRSVEVGAPCAQFATLRAALGEIEKHMWGVVCPAPGKPLERVEFTVHLEAGEEYIFQRLCREKRCGTVERLDAHTCRFTAQVYDTVELLPWIRTYLCRIESLRFSNRSAENRFKQDLQAMYRLYGLEEEQG